MCCLCWRPTTVYLARVRSLSLSFCQRCQESCSESENIQRGNRGCSRKCGLHPLQSTQTNTRNKSCAVAAADAVAFFTIHFNFSHFMHIYEKDIQCLFTLNFDFRIFGVFIVVVVVFIYINTLVGCYQTADYILKKKRDFHFQLLNWINEERKYFIWNFHRFWCKIPG